MAPPYIQQEIEETSRFKIEFEDREKRSSLEESLSHTSKKKFKKQPLQKAPRPPRGKP
jgi:hypothetical protein